MIKILVTLLIMVCITFYMVLIGKSLPMLCEEHYQNGFKNKLKLTIYAMPTAIILIIVVVSIFMEIYAML